MSNLISIPDFQKQNEIGDMQLVCDMQNSLTKEQCNRIMSHIDNKHIDDIDWPENLSDGDFEDYMNCYDVEYKDIIQAAEECLSPDEKKEFINA